MKLQFYFDQNILYTFYICVNINNRAEHLVCPENPDILNFYHNYEGKNIKNNKDFEVLLKTTKIARNLVLQGYISLFNFQMI